MANHPSQPSTRPSSISLVLASALSALLVVGVYQVRARLSKGHDAQPAPAQRSGGEDEAGGAGQRIQLGESCDDLKKRYTLRCSTDLALPVVGSRGTPVATPASMTPEYEALEIAQAFAWAHPPKSELADMASRCQLRLVSPVLTEVAPPTVDDEQAKALSLSGNERAVLEQTLREMHQSYADSVRKAYVSGMADPSGGTTLSVEQIINELERRPESGYNDVTQKLALERAGMAAPPGPEVNLPPGEQVFRLSAGLGDEFERRLADRLGVDRARQLVYSPLASGWTARSTQEGCPSEP